MTDLSTARELGTKMGTAGRPPSDLEPLWAGESDEYRSALTAAYWEQIPERRRWGTEVWQVAARQGDDVVAVRVAPNGVVGRFRATWPSDQWAELPLEDRPS